MNNFDIVELWKNIAEHRDTWQNLSKEKWLSGLQEEVSELTLALNGEHKDSPTHELIQIAGIAINWLIRGPLLK